MIDTDLLKKCHRQQYSVDPKRAVGLGWMLIETSNETQIIMHNGGTGGFRTFLGFNPKIQKGIVILTNSTSDWPDIFGISLLDPEFKTN